MSASTQAQPKTSTQQAVSTDPSPPTGSGGSSEAMFNEQALSFTTTDLNLVEMTEIEYTQLQHILYSHMEAQANEGEMETRLNSAFFTASNPSNLPQYQTTNINQASFSASTAGGQTVHPVICQSTVASEGNIVGSNQSLGHIDFQELRMLLLSESSLPVNSGNQAEKTPGNGAGDSSGTTVVRVKHANDAGGNNKENENVASVCEPRSKSAVRVRLEDRFNSIQSEMPRCQEPQESGGVTLNNLVTLIRHSPELMGVPLHQQQSKRTTLVKNKAAGATTALQFTYPFFTTNACSSGSGNSSETQTSSSGNLYPTSGGSCPLLEAAKLQEITLPRTFSFCYQQEIESTKQTLGARNKTLPEQVWIKVGEALCKQAVNKRSRSRLRQLDTSVERRALSNIQNVGDAQNQGAAAAWPSSQPHVSDPSQGGQQGGSSQRREKHNRMERERRRRIRICCDELNHLVPFCNAETDKATTLQWATAFLKYIQERHGDSLKQEFESVFCGKTGRRLKVTRSDALRTGPTQDSVQSGSTMERK
ncbi:transcription factor-like 5 protein isoform X1 [Ascaphus truei]|uniref:transcription factor-like 5 protein isoform X1 n=1 Tax=Ascaphus truei TaxID=8439 RepID=UPI003F5A925F